MGRCMILTIRTAYPNAGTVGLPLTPDALPYPTAGWTGFLFFCIEKGCYCPIIRKLFRAKWWITQIMWMVVPAALMQNGVIYQAMCANCGGGANFPYHTWCLGNSKTCQCKL